MKTSNARRTLFVALVFAALSYSLPVEAQVGRPKGYDKAVVVSATAEASKAGAAIMRAGGNAVDAAVAVHFALAVTFPAAGNLGGGGFMVVRQPEGECATLDFRETAPAAATAGMYLDDQGEVVPGLSLNGHLASGVPGSVDGMFAAHQRFGTMAWAKLLEPAIALAEKGFPLGSLEAASLNQARGRLGRFPGSMSAFLRDDGGQWKEGQSLAQPDLAKTLRRIAEQGRDDFYLGETARLLVEEMERGKGIVAREDLERYRSVWREPVLLKYKNYRLITMGPPSSGGIALGQMLGMLETRGLAASGFQSAATVHVMAESMRRAYADRAVHLGDPDFHPVPVTGLLSPAYLAKRMEDFDPAGATPSGSIEAGNPLPAESEETTHYSIVDPAGMAVAVTTTLNGGYGSGVTVQGAGFLLNNEMDDFSAKPGTPNLYGLIGGAANAIQPGKRMLSSMTPTIVEQDGKLRMVLGTPGGATIITTVLQNFINMAEFGMDVQQAVAAPRFHHQWQPDRLQVEAFGFSPDTSGLLNKMGHRVSVRGSYSGRADCIFVDKNGKRWGGADPRGEGAAIGF